MLRDQMLRLDLSVGQVRIPGRTYEGIRRQALKLCLIEKIRHPPLGESQIALLCELRKQGLSATQISNFDLLGFPHRTADAIQKHLSRLGLVNQNRSLAAKHRKIWSNGELERFDNFLRENSKKMPPRQIAEIFGATRSTVDKRQRELGVKPSSKQVLAMPFVKERIKDFLCQRSKKIILGFGKRLAQREKELEALAEKLRSNGAPPADRQCKKCGKVWLRHRKFFFHCKGKTAGYSLWYFARICVLCEAQIRHERRMPRYRREYAI